MGRLKGEGMALAGLIMGYVSLAIIPFILIIAAIAIPSLLRSRQVANESAAVANLRTINVAETRYFLSKGSFGSLTNLVTADLLDARFTGPVSGYKFAIEATRADYRATATPTSTNTGRYGYYSTMDAVIRYEIAPSTTCRPCFPAGRSGDPIQ